MKSLVVAGLLVCASAMELSRVYMARSGSSDLETSASGYAYRSVSGQPASYAYYSTNPGLQPVHYVQAGGYLVPQFKPLLPKPEEIAVELDDPGYVANVAPTKYTQVVLGNGESFEKGGGQNYHAAKKSSQGEKGEKGYDSKHGYGVLRKKEIAPT